MEFLVKYGFYILIGILAIGVWLLLKAGKKDMLKKSAMIAVEKVAEHFLSLDNSAKLAKAVEITYSLIPSWLRWIVSKKMLGKLVDEVYQEMKDYIKSKLTNTERIAKDLALGTVTGTIKEAIELDFGGDKNLVSNDQLKNLNLKAEERVDRIYGDLKYRTDFRDEKELIASLGFNKTF